jgi:DNA-binding transcriptional ArsR family regulator
MLWETTDMSETPDEILRALADPERLAIAGLLARGSASGPMLAAALDLPVKRVRSHLNRLVSAGVVRLNEDHASYRLDGGTLRWAAEQVGPTRETGMALGTVTPTEESVLRTFFRNGRLTEIPAKRSKRRMVLERIALEFEPGRRYAEKEATPRSPGTSPITRRSAGRWSTKGSSTETTGSTGGRAERWIPSEGVR